MTVASEAKGLEGTPVTFVRAAGHGARGGAFFRRGNRQLVFSIGLAIVVEAGLLLWFAQASCDAIQRGEQLAESTSKPKPMEIRIVQPRPEAIRPMPARVRMPAIRKLPILPRLAERKGAIVFPPIRSPLPPPPIDWHRALQHYLERQEAKITPFAMPVLPTRPPSAYDLPTRIRLPGGGEIDRIGDSCYAVPAADPIASQGTNESVLPREMFAHEVPCRPGAQHSFGSEFLKRLRKHHDAKPGSGR